MTRLERIAVVLLRPCRFRPGAVDLRFVRQMFIHAAWSCGAPITPGQSRYLFELVFRYRGQIIDRMLTGGAPLRRGRRRRMMNAE